MPTPVNVWLCEECGAVAHGGRSDNPHVWEYLGRPSGRDYHRYFRSEDTGNVSIADNGGPTPDDTDDGPLWIDQGAEIEICSLSTGMCAAIPVLCHGDPSRVYVELGDLAWLLKNGLVERSKVKLPEDGVGALLDALGARG